MSYQTFADFKKTLKSLELEQILYLYLIEGTPYIFRNNNAKYQAFRKSISSILDVPIKNIVIVGSARLGFSLNPYHFGRNFGKKSDIDIVVVSAELFDRAWLELIRMDIKWYDLSEPERKMVKAHVEHIYWGNIRPEKLPATTQISRVWLETFSGITQVEEFAKRKVNAFLFRTWWQVQSFYMRALRKLRSEFLEG
jgi:hypothetical protein